MMSFVGSSAGCSASGEPSGGLPFPFLAHSFPMSRPALRLFKLFAAAAVFTGCAGTESQPETPKPSKEAGGARSSDFGVFGSFSSDHSAEDDARGEAQNPWSSCYGSFSPGLDPAADLARLAAACAAPAGFTAITPVYIGEPQSEDAPEDRLTFLGRAGRCYRVFSIGGPSVADLDVAILGPDGRIVAADASRDRFPIVPSRGPLCLQDDQNLTIHVAVVQGAGSYLMQVWGNSVGN